MDIKEIISKINETQNGTDVFNYLTISLSKQSETDRKEIKSFTTSGSQVNIFRRGDYVQLDILFKSMKDSNLVDIYKIVELYKQLGEEYQNNEHPEFLPCLSATVIPFSLNGRYYTIGFYPIFAEITLDGLNENKPKLSILFNADDFLLYETSDINLDTLKKESEIEIRDENTMNDEIIKREQEKEDARLAYETRQ